MNKKKFYPIVSIFVLALIVSACGTPSDAEIQTTVNAAVAATTEAGETAGQNVVSCTGTYGSVGYSLGTGMALTDTNTGQAVVENRDGTCYLLVPPPAPLSVAPTAQAAAPTGLKYQYDAGCAQTSTPMEYPACILQRVQAGELTGEQAVVMIQTLGQKFSAPSYEGMTLTFANTQPVLAWCPGGVNHYPPDTAKPLVGTNGAKWADLLFVVDAGTGGPDRKIEANGSPCWIVYRR